MTPCRADTNGNPRADDLACTVIAHIEADPRVFVSDSIVEQARRARIVGDEHVGVAVVVDVAESGPATDFRNLENLTGLTGYIYEDAVAGVSETTGFFA